MAHVAQEPGMKQTPRTSVEWWVATKADPARLAQWLRRQYVGEMAAVNLLSELLIRFGSQAPADGWHQVHKVMCQEATHARWVYEVMAARGIAPEPNGNAERRYWAQVLPNVNSWAEAMAAGYHAERMRLERIRVIAADLDPAVDDLRVAFSRILPHEEWHERVFDHLRGGTELTRYHERGLDALNLTLS